MHNTFIPCNQPPESLLFPASPLKSSKYHFNEIGETQSMIHPEAKFLSSCEPVNLDKLYAFKILTVEQTQDRRHHPKKEKLERRTGYMQDKFH